MESITIIRTKMSDKSYVYDLRIKNCDHHVEFALPALSASEATIAVSNVLTTMEAALGKKIAWNDMVDR